MNLKIVRLVDIYAGIVLAYLVFFFKRIFGKSGFTCCDTGCNRALLVKFWGVGNVAMLLPAARALKDKYPEAEIDFLTLFNNKDVSKAAGIFDNIYTLDSHSFSRFVASLLRIVTVLKKRNYDLIIDFEQFARFSGLFCSIIGRKNILGFDTARQHRHFLYTKSVKYDNNIHITKSFYMLAELAGASHKGEIEAFPLACKNEDIHYVQGMLKSMGIEKDHILVILHAGTSENFNLRRWPAENFSFLADRLIDEFSARIIFTGLADEVALADKAAGNLKNREKAFNLAGKLNFGQFISLIKLSDLVVSSDTAPVHLSSSLAVPTVGLYGPNSPHLYGPWGRSSIWFYKKLNCSPCITNYNAKINKCRHPEGKGTCMKKIGVEEVFLGIKNDFFEQNAKFRLRKLGKDTHVPLKAVTNG